MSATAFLAKMNVPLRCQKDGGPFDGMFSPSFCGLKGNDSSCEQNTGRLWKSHEGTSHES